MAKDDARVSIVDISYERLDEAADVLARAFANYPLVQLFLEESGEDYARHVWEAMRITAEVRLTLGESVKGVVVGDRLVAAACIATPEEKQWPQPLENAYAAFERRVGALATRRLNQYGEASAKHHPQQPHFYLVAIGVLPEVQGKGYGRVLLNTVHDMSAAHPFSTGVGLDTETPVNVPIYEHCGYHITARDKLDDVDIWFMFRPDEAGSDPNA